MGGEAVGFWEGKGRERKGKYSMVGVFKSIYQVLSRFESEISAEILDIARR